jgi:SAM-dependent methyltransferase
MGLEQTTCNLCGSDRWRLMYRKFNLDIVRCKDCGLVYAGPLRLTPEASWLRYSPDYFHNEYLPALGIFDGQFDLSLFDGRYAHLLQHVREYRSLGALFEIGCGAGFFLKAAERAGWKVAGLEVSQAAVEFARGSLGLDIQRSTVEEATLPADTFDVVAMLDTIEHLFDPAATLRATHRLLRPGGAALITTPNINSLSRVCLGEPWAVLSPAEHLYYFAEGTLSRMLQLAGFTNVRFDRHYAGQGLYETMNPPHNQAPDARRTKLYTRLVNTIGRRVLRQVQGLGLADALVCVAEKPALTP